MDVYVARQPIFDRSSKIVGYELLYRDAASPGQALFTDGDQATRRLLSDAVTVFGLPKLTDNKTAYINFTDSLILNNFVSLVHPKEIVVELLESIRVTETLVAKVKALKERGYRFALDDYTGDSVFDPLLPYVDILKVDFRLTTPQIQRDIVKRFAHDRWKVLLAEKVETQEEFHRAVKLGYSQFQGYFFTKPVTMRKSLPILATSTHVRILGELEKPTVDFAKCAEIVHSDVTMTYRVMQHVQSLRYYRGNLIQGIQQALVLMGSHNVRRLVLLAMARENNVTQSDELIRAAYLRGVFARRLTEHMETREDEEDSFLLGMFSMLDQILGTDMGEILGEIHIPSRVSATLLGYEDPLYGRLLRYVKAYESGEWSAALPDIGLDIEGREIARLYMESMAETDKAFYMI